MSVVGHLQWTLFKRGELSAVTGIYLFRLLLNIVYVVLRSFFTLTNRIYPDEMPHGVFQQFTSVKNMYRKTYFTIEMQLIMFLKIFLVSYAFTGCNLRVGKLDVSASNIIIFCVNISSSSV